MKTICLYFQVHQPYRLRQYRFFDIGKNHDYFDDYTNRSIMRKIAKKCYLPANEVMLELIQEHGEKFKVTYSISGVALEQFERYVPEVIESFQKLAKTGSVEFLAETYAHSLVSLNNKEEFVNQVTQHANKIEALFDQKPTAFRNTELIYDDEIGQMVYDMGYKVMLTEGAKHVLGWRSPNFVYYNSQTPKLKLLLKNFKLSDDIAFRFSNKGWEEWPLTSEKFVGWLNDIDQKEEIVNLFMDYETFGEHQWADTGIFEFIRNFPKEVFKSSKYEFATPSEIAQKHQPQASLHVPYPISWADEERDLTAWLGNELQDEAFDKLYQLRSMIEKVNDEGLLNDWNYLQTSDHFYYMCTKFFADGDVHMYFNPYDGPYEAFINYMNVLSDFSKRVEDAIQKEKPLHTNITNGQSKKELKKLAKKYEAELKKIKNLI